MADDQQIPPDNLKLKETNDSNFVTEELAAMKPIFHRMLAVWNIITGLAALWWALTIWPPDMASEQAGVSTNTSRTTNSIADSLKNKSASDTLNQTSMAGKDTSEILMSKSNERTDRGILLLKLSFLFGVLGGATHGFSSLIDFRGQRRLFRSWILWYFGRPILGGMLAVIVYVALRAGFFSGDATSNAANFYGIAAFSTLTGMFTDAATNKLGEVFSTMFSIKGKEREANLRLNNQLFAAKKINKGADINQALFCKYKMEIEMLLKKFLIPAIMMSILITIGCGTPMAVKSLSAEQLKTLSSYQETQKKYFDIIERYVSAHIETTEILIKEETQGITNNLKKKAVLQLNDKNADTGAVLNELISGIQSETESDQNNIKQLVQLLSDLKQKHREMKDAYSVILNAQTKLDEYIQLEKADEVFVNQVLATVGIQKEKITSIFDNVGSIMENIEKYLKQGTKK